jgi:vacuolar-type H+-ATPase subunit E/Vma4
MSLEHLVATLEHDTEVQIAAELAAAREAAARLESEAARRLDLVRDETLRDRRRRIQQTTDRELAARRRDGRREVLLARHRVFDRALGRALKLMPEVVQSREYLNALSGELDLALSYLGPGDAIVRCSPLLTPAMRSRLAGRPQLRLEEDSALAPGFQVVATDSSVLVDRTLPRRLTLEESRFRLELLRQVDRRDATLG